ncbi:11265_t:CDS:2 [Dentiscutata heterogama]|uniref:11265_t:CDS:1 n=1 Tax=Dentiscutata heterogama TaxID=1316150 RepID=A0ACA9JVK6_9GLOM|nr:11265_t:CDS:2 [Dentiscutata heterogama]
MPATVTVLCYITNHRKSFASKNLSIVEASGVIRSRSLNTSLNITLIGFYHDDTIQELSLPEFKEEDVVLATGNFRIVEGVDNEGNKYPILRIILNDIVCFNNIDPNDLPAFPILINMTAITQEDPTIGEEDVTFKVLVKNFIDQDYVNIEIICYHPVSTRHLMNVTAVIRKHTVLYINGELIITDDSNIVYIKSISFPEFQKITPVSRGLIELPWESKNQNDKTTQSTVAQTIAGRVKGNIRKKPILTTNPYPKTKPRSIRPKVADLANNLLNKNSNISNQTTENTNTVGK